MELSTKLSNFALGVIWRSVFRPGYSPKAMRTAFEAITGISAETLSKKFSGLNIRSIEHDGLPIEFMTTSRGKKKTILFLHGGGYFMGSIRAYRRNALRIAYTCHCEVVTTDYRLAPEHPYPAALEDSVKAYILLLETQDPSELVIAGDSAGGGLAVATALYLRDHNLPLPSCIFSISPWADLTGKSKTISTNDGKDVWLTKKHFHTWAPWYAPEHDHQNPYVSPVFADLTGLPRMLILAGDQETLLGDTLTLHKNALKSQVDCTIDIGKDMQHDWMLALPFLKESKRAMQVIQNFVLR